MPAIGSGHVEIEYEDQRADVVIDRPKKRNAMNEQTVADLTKAVRHVDED